jgi:hypothetical protein
MFKSVKQAWKEGTNPDRMCCFCGLTIDGNLQHILLPLEAEAWQSLTAHGDCLKARLDSSVPYLTPDEAAEG